MIFKRDITRHTFVKCAFATQVENLVVTHRSKLLKFIAKIFKS